MNASNASVPVLTAELFDCCNLYEDVDDAKKNELDRMERPATATWNATRRLFGE